MRPLILSIGLAFLCGCDIDGRVAIESNPPIKIGQVRVWPEINPFQTNQTKIHILDMKEGYVLYKFVGGSGRTYSDTISGIRLLYSKVEKN